MLRNSIFFFFGEWTERTKPQEDGAPPCAAGTPGPPRRPSGTRRGWTPRRTIRKHGSDGAEKESAA